MNAADRERVKELLSRAARLAPQERAAFIRREAVDEAAIATEALDLLSTLDDSAFMSAPTGSGFTATLDPAMPLTEGPGASIGRYKLLQLIGEGGFGAVFMAEQFEPVNRRVAIKIIKAGMDTKQVIARFEAERQALAMMDHPNIARVLDGGATESGRPYFVMELVRGDPVTAYCDRERLEVRQRLVLFREICHAVQHAHQKGIIHRDIKPSNILVTVADGEPLPKVIDFGIAKATAGRLTNKTLFTEMHQLIGTPQYMSPEQAEASSADIDTRSDIYALGVVLYELLSGTTPLETSRLRSAPLAEVQRLIREEDPPRPSLRLATLASSGHNRWTTPVPAAGDDRDSSAVEIARRRGSEPAPLARALRGDLDWIVMKCLEKDRRRRYATAGELADDLRRYLAHEPVLATPPSRGYRFQKFVRRNRGWVIAGSTIAATLVAATGVSLAFALRASRALAAESEQRKLAEKNAEETRQVAEFQQAQLSGIDARTMGVRLRGALLEKAQASAERSNLPQQAVEARIAELEALIAGSDFTGIALESLDENFFQPALAAIEAQFADQPLVKADLLQTVASTLHELGLLDAATGPQTEALTIRRKELGEDHPDTVSSLYNLGSLLQARGRLEEAAPLYRDALERRRRTLGEDHPDTLTCLAGVGYLLANQGKWEEAEPYYREALETGRRVLGDEHPHTLLSINNMAALLQTQRKFGESERLYREALEKRRRLLGDEHPDTLQSINNLGNLLESQRKNAEAEPYYREALETRRRVLGDEHPHTLSSISNLGTLLQSDGRLSDAEPYSREALKKRRHLLGDDHPDTLTSINNLAVLLIEQGKLDEAELYYRELLEKVRRVLGDAHPNTFRTIMNLSSLLQKQGRHSEAVDLLAGAEPTARQRFTGPNVPRLGRFLIALGHARVEAGQFDIAEANLSEAHEILGVPGVAPHWNPADSLKELVQLYDAWHAAEPNQGHDVKAAEWRAKPAAWQASTQPALP